ncbi:MAG TPA: sialidase family protein [Candidatus Acidoferrum sp.]|nr:sialidase family protein [Candidatus Acidoferrum sp.]
MGVSAFYRSTDNGASWTGGILPGTVGRSSGGDPSLDYGPSRCQDGQFRFSCGTVIYYANLEDPVDPDLHLSEGMGVARSFDDGATWQTPVQVTSVSKSNFDDHEWIAVDNKQPSSPFFGRVYVFWAVFCASCAGNGNVKLFVAHSSDEGATWSAPVQVSQGGTNNSGQGIRETGQMAVSSNGTVEAFWSEDEDSTHTATLQVTAVSNDGGASFSGPLTIASVTDYPLTGTPFDVVDLFNRVPGMSARVDCFPHPGAAQSGGAVYVVWCDFTGGHGVVKAAVSLDGANWQQLGTIADLTGRNAFFPAVSVDPAGTVNLTFDALTAPPADNPFQTGVQVYDNYFAQSVNQGATFTPPLRVSSMSSNPDSSSYNNLKEQFIGDYIGIVSGPGQAFVVWTDSRNAAACSVVDTYRNQVYAGSKTAVAPNPDSACDTSFGNTDTYEATISY